MADFIGRTFGKYQLTERLGRGGMADVYKALQPGLDRFVAVKTMHSHLADSQEFIARFKREAQSVAALRHPHIVQVIDFDQEEDVFYMVMEYVQGRTLKAHVLDKGVLPPPEALTIASQLGSALDYAHQHNMIHRDLKPANVMFSDGSNSHAVLMDFGIARIMDASGLTMSGMTVGTPAYMSPEAGRGERVDERGDIYSMGVMLYEMVTGNVPYDADTPYAVIMKHINDPLPPPRNFNADLPDDIERIIFKALMKNPEERYQTAGDLHKAILEVKEILLHKSPTDVRPVAPAGDPTAPLPAVGEEATVVDQPSAARQPSAAIPAPAVADSGVAPAQSGTPWLPIIGIGVVALAAIAIVAAIVVTAGGGDDPVLPTAVAAIDTVAPPTNEPPPPTDEPLPTDEAPPTEAATAQPEPTDALTDEPESTAVALANPPDTVREINPEAERALDDGFRQLDLGNPEAAVEAFTRAIELDPDNPTYYNERAWTLVGLDNYGSALEDFSRVIELEPDNPEGYQGRGNAYLNLGEDDQAIADYSRAIALDPQEPEGYYSRGWAYEAVGDAESALADWNRAIELFPDDPYYYQARAYGYQLVDDFGRALEDYSRSIELDPNDAGLYEARAWALLEREEYDAAISDFSNAIALDPNNPGLYFGRADSFSMLGDLRSALEDYDALIALEPDLPDARERRGWTLLELGQPERAIEDFSRAIDLNPGNPLLFEGRAQGYMELGDFPLAIEDFTQALEREPFNAAFYNGRGWAHLNLGDIPQALDNFSQAIENEPDNPAHYEGRGRTNLDRSQPEQAIADFTRAVNLGQDNGFAHNGLGVSYFVIGDFKAALENLTRAVELNPEEPYFYFDLANVQFEEKQLLEESLENYRRYVELAGDNADPFALERIEDLETALGLK